MYIIEAEHDAKILELIHEHVKILDFIISRSIIKFHKNSPSKKM